jgi:hypothetical protein
MDRSEYVYEQQNCAHEAGWRRGKAWARMRVSTIHLLSYDKPWVKFFQMFACPNLDGAAVCI